MIPKPWMPIAAQPPHPIPYGARKCCKSWDPPAFGKARYIAGPFLYENTKKGRREYK